MSNKKSVKSYNVPREKNRGAESSFFDFFYDFGYTYAMNIKTIPYHKEIGLVVGSETSSIGKAAEEALLNNFTIIKTSKKQHMGERMYLDITDTTSIKGFIQDILKKYPGKKLKVLFLNAGNMIFGDTIHRGNFFRRSNEGDKDINTHIYNLVLVESLERAGIIDTNTKIIYNASTQIFGAREGFEDYAKLKNMVSSILLQDENLDVSILVLSLVKGSRMAQKFEEIMQDKGGDINIYIKEHMPQGQPTLDQVKYITEKIIEYKKETKGKIICLDGGRIQSLDINIPKECIYFDEKRDRFSSYT